MDNIINRKKYIQCIFLIICSSFFVEIFVFNFRTYESLFYQERLLGEFESRVEAEEENGVSSLFITVNGEKIKNLFLDVAFKDAESETLEGVKTVIAAQGGKDADFRVAAEQMIYPDKAASKYVFLSTGGNTEQIRIDFPVQKGKSLRVFGVKINAHRPLYILWWRLGLVCAIGLFVFFLSAYLRKGTSVPDQDGESGAHAEEEI